jgi:hypothetical protein
MAFTAYEPGIDGTGASISEVDGSPSSGQTRVYVTIGAGEVAPTTAIVSPLGILS